MELDKNAQLLTYYTIINRWPLKHIFRPSQNMLLLVGSVILISL